MGMEHIRWADDRQSYTIEGAINSGQLGPAELDAIDALRHCDISLKFNELDGQEYVRGFEGSDEWLYLDGSRVNALWFIVQGLGLQPAKTLFKDAVEEIAQKNSFHPVKEYFDELSKWKGKKRTRDWLPHDAKTDDNKYIRELGELMLVD